MNMSESEMLSSSALEAIYIVFCSYLVCQHQTCEHPQPGAERDFSRAAALICVVGAAWHIMAQRAIIDNLQIYGMPGMYACVSVLITVLPKATNKMEPKPPQECGMMCLLPCLYLFQQRLVAARHPAGLVPRKLQPDWNQLESSASLV